MLADIQTIQALGDLLEQAQERLHDNYNQLPDWAAEREQSALDALWRLHESLLAQA